jgi:curved DNA-binding protein CbpA
MTSSLPPDPWKALGIERNADKSEIRTAYRKLVLKCHPDKIQDPTLKALKADEFQKVQQAWELLNDDAEKAKYEQKLRLAELQRAAKVQQDVKNSPNTSVPRSSSKYAAYEVRTAEPGSRYKSSPSGGKVYAFAATTHTRSHEEMPSVRTYTVYDEPDKQARRTASYEKPAKRDDERRERDKEERRRRREEEAFRLQEKERERDRERERERKKEDERERKAEKKRLEREREKEREKDRKRDAEDKARRHKPYVEHYDPYTADMELNMEDMILEDIKHVAASSKPEKKRSSSRKHEEPRERERERERERDKDRDREREKSSSRRAKSPHVDTERKHIDLFEHAASYLASSGATAHASSAFWKSQTPPEPSYITPQAPTPPPVDFEEESIRQASARAAGRRASNDPARSREKLGYGSSDVATPKSRPIPSLSKSYTTPPPAPESPPRVSRSQTAPHGAAYGPIPTLSRNQTWAPSSNAAPAYYEEMESDDDHRRRRSRRARSPGGQSTRYKVEAGKTSKLEPQYSYSGSPTSTRRYAADGFSDHLGHSPSSAAYTHGHIRVKQTKSYEPEDVIFAQYNQPAYYSPHGGDAYTAKA